MIRNATAIALIAFSAAALACDDAPRGKSASYAPDDGVPDKVAEVRTATPTKEAAATPAAQPVAKKQAEPKRKPQGKPL